MDEDIQVSFRIMDRMLFRDLMIDKEKLRSANLSSSERKSTLDLINIPLTNEESDLGEPLPVVIDEDPSYRLIKQIHFSIDGGASSCNFLDREN